MMSSGNPSSRATKEIESLGNPRLIAAICCQMDFFGSARIDTLYGCSEARVGATAI